MGRPNQNIEGQLVFMKIYIKNNWATAVLVGWLTFALWATASIVNYLPNRFGNDVGALLPLAMLIAVAIIFIGRNLFANIVTRFAQDGYSAIESTSTLSDPLNANWVICASSTILVVASVAAMQQINTPILTFSTHDASWITMTNNEAFREFATSSNLTVPDNL